MAFIVTIGREYGSGGHYIAQELAKKLNIKFYDNALIEKAAQESGLGVDYIKENEEKKDSIFAFMGMSEFATNYQTVAQKVFLAQSEAIKKIAESNENAIIVGRCADYVLRDYPNLVSIYITAPFEDKVKRAVQYYNIEENKAADIIRKNDKRRGAYYNYFTDKKWGAPCNYDLCINSNIGVIQAVDIIINFINTKFKLDL